MSYRIPLIFALTLSFPALANPGVKKDTDIGKAKVVRHSQVTYDKGEGTTQVVTVTVFDRARAEEHYRQECVVSVQGRKRYSTCKTVKLAATTATPTPAPATPPVATLRQPYSGAQCKPEVSQDNRLMFHAGVGPTGLSTNEGPNGTEVKQERGVVLGLGYSRHLGKGLNLGVSVYSNSMVMGTVGVDLQ